MCQTVVTLIKYICLSFHGLFQGGQPKITGSSQPGALCSYIFMKKIKQTYLFLRQWRSQMSCGKAGRGVRGFTSFLLEFRSCIFPQLLAFTLCFKLHGCFLLHCSQHWIFAVSSFFDFCYFIFFLFCKFLKVKIQNQPPSLFKKSFFEVNNASGCV